MATETTGRRPDGKFLPGYTANGGGRPKGLEKRVRELVEDDLPAMIEVMKSIVLGRPLPGSSELTIKTRDRTEALKLLLDRGWGKARVTVDLATNVTNNGVAGINVDELDDAAFDVLSTALEEALARAKSPKGLVDASAVEVK